ncbi:hypothetical protein [Embleya sp. NPDC005971]|uniref:hypothetical protein n=1 Tax=unclassified Embleya TaxID=2699296 RepID=UPI0033C642A2
MSTPPPPPPPPPLSVRLLVLLALAGGTAIATWRHPSLGLPLTVGVSVLLALHAMTQP